MPIDQYQARGAAHLVTIHGVRNRTGGIRLIQRNREFQAVLVNERLEYGRIESIVMLESRMQTDDCNVTGCERCENPLRLRNAGADRNGT